jgi:hypothetical protein
MTWGAGALPPPQIGGNAKGTLVSVTDPLNHTTTYGYDAADPPDRHIQ